MLLSGVLVFLLAALFKPTIPIKHNIYTCLLYTSAIRAFLFALVWLRANE